MSSLYEFPLGKNEDEGKVNRVTMRITALPGGHPRNRLNRRAKPGGHKQPVSLEGDGKDLLPLSLPVAAASATADENASVENRWSELRDTVQWTALVVLGRARRQHQY
ncbi:hypothetical protein SprV_0602200300 [Sparganum proliferum]